MKQTDWKDSTKVIMEAYGDNPKDFPYQEPKQETLEEAAKNYICKPQNNDYGDYNSFIEGAKWQQKRSYSEEDVYDLLVEWTAYQNGFPRVDEDEIPNGFMSFNRWFEQFKKK